jgi:predicted amidohydrolase
MAVMPEYAGLELAAGDAPDLAAELRAGCALAPAALAIARDAAHRHNIWLLPGSMPWRDGSLVHNRAPLISPDGRVAFQDKHVMTRFEAESWGVSPGTAPRVFDTPWGRIGIAICYDLEFPSLTRAQTEAGAWLILAPSCTDTLAGWNRVRIAARARAMESQCFVAVAPTTGLAPWIAALDENRGAAGVYGPMDRGFPDDGVIAEGGEGDGAALVVELDPARLSAVRASGAVLNHRDHPAPPPTASASVFT